jgi:hypothetical protein
VDGVDGDGQTLLRGVLHVEEGVRKLSLWRYGDGTASATDLTKEGSWQQYSTGERRPQWMGGDSVDSSSDS